MSSCLSEVFRLKHFDLNQFQTEENERHKHADTIANNNLKWIVSPKQSFILIGNILVPKHLHKEWNDVKSVKDNESPEVRLCVSEQWINDLLKNYVEFNFITVGLVDTAHQTT